MNPAKSSLRRMAIRYYVEKDGKIFLVARGKLLDLPTRAELPFPVKREQRMPVPAAHVVYAEPDIPYPDHWMHKDDVVGRRDVTPLVQLAVNRTLVRHTAKALILRDGKVLMVKASRGYTKGSFNLPGGFINFGETPEESLAREVKEETGLHVRVGKLLSLSTATFLPAGHYVLSFIYLASVRGGRLHPDPTEIAEVQWLSLREAVRQARNPLILAELKEVARIRRR